LTHALGVEARLTAHAGSWHGVAALVLEDGVHSGAAEQSPS
jgi:hypothetical protein